MGGMGSGRSGGRPTVEAGFKLSIPWLLVHKAIQPGRTVHGTLTWPSTYRSDWLRSIDYQAQLDEQAGRLRLVYGTPDLRTGEQHPSDYWLDLVTTPQPFGGFRWWFRCPRNGSRVATLHMPAGGRTFASRHAWGLAYASQRQSPRDRATTQAFNQRRRLGDHQGGIGEDVPKPKWMRWATYDRRMDRIDAAEELCNAHLGVVVERLLARARA